MANRVILSETSYHGVGAIREVANGAKAREFREAFICSDPNLAKFNVTTKMTKVLEDAGFTYEIYSNIRPSPTIENVQTGVAALRASDADYVIAIGGGSSTDASKAIGIIITNPKLEDVGSLEGVTPTKNPCVPIIMVPTAAGTAAEITISYVTTDIGKKHRFMYVDTHDIPVVAVVGSEMMASVPKGLTATADMGALTHAIERYTAKDVWEMTDMFNLEAVEITAYNLKDTVENKPEDRGGMALEQYLTGMGFSSCGLGVVHSMAHDLGALYDTPHDAANAIILLTAMGYNTPRIGTRSKDITVAMGVEGAGGVSQEEYRKATVDAVEKLSQDVGILADLKKIIKPEDVGLLPQPAMDGTCRPGSPKDPSLEDIENLYLSLM